jgi:hypothetical protein
MVPPNQDEVLSVLAEPPAPNITRDFEKRKKPPTELATTSMTLKDLKKSLNDNNIGYEKQASPTSKSLLIPLTDNPQHHCIAQEHSGGIDFSIGATVPEPKKTDAVAMICSVAAKAAVSNEKTVFTIPKSGHEKETFHKMVQALKAEGLKPRDKITNYKEMKKEHRLPEKEEKKEKSREKRSPSSG